MDRVSFCGVDVSRLVVGGNPISGFSHQSPERDRQMREYFTPRRVFDFLADAEARGINTWVARTDEHITGLLSDYRAGGGTIQWIAQVVYDRQDPDVHRRWIDRAGELGAVAMYLHGGATDYWFANGMLDLFDDALRRMRACGVPAGFAGHRVDAHTHVRDHVRPDFQMCCYYNPTDRARNPDHGNIDEKWDVHDRAAMLEFIAQLPTPAIHYKVFGGGNRPIDEAFEVLGRSVRDGDIVCIGVFPGDDAGMLARDIELFERHVEGRHLP